MVEKILLYQTNSLVEFVAVKKKLKDNGIEYFEKVKGNHRWGLFIMQLFTSATATYGMNGEHDINYFIYVDAQSYSQAKKVLMK